jgi:hypothetical protein
MVPLNCIVYISDTLEQLYVASKDVIQAEICFLDLLLQQSRDTRYFQVDE